MSIDRFVDITINRNFASQPQTTFGSLLAVFQLTAAQQPERVKTYASAQEVTDSALPQTVKNDILTLFRQQNGLGTINVGRQNATAFDTLTLEIADAAPAAGVYTITVGAEVLSFEAIAGTTAIELATSFFEQIEELQLDVDATVTPTALNPGPGATFTFTARDSGELLAAAVTLDPSSNLTITSATVAPAAPEAIQDALDAIEADGDTSYGLVISANDDQSILDAAEWVQTRRRLFGALTNDSLLRAGTAGNIADQLATLDYGRVFVTYTRDLSDRKDIAIMADRLALRLDQEQGTWAHTPLTGLTPDNTGSNRLTNAEIAQIEAGPANTYTRCGTRNVFFAGVMTNGLYIDQQTTQDWAISRLETAIFDVLSGNRLGVSYTVQGVALIEGAIRGVANLGERILHFAPGSTDVQVPDPIDLTAAQRQSRCLPEVQLSYREAGFIHKVVLTVTISS